MPYPMSDAVCVRDGPWRLSQRWAGFPNARASSWLVLRRLLLGPDGVVVRGRHNERALDCLTRATRPPGEGRSVRPPDHFACRNGPHRGRRVVILDWNALRALLGTTALN